MEYRKIKGYINNKKIKNNNILRYKYNKIPSILYGKKINLNIIIKKKNIEEIINKEEISIIKVILNNKKEIKTIIKEVQRHPVTDEIIHVDFHKFEKDKNIIIKIPIKTKGRPIGVSKGGVLIKGIKKLKIKGLLKNIPNIISIDISDLDIGDNFHLKKLKNKNYEILDNDNIIVLSIKQPKVSSSKTTDNKE